MSGPVVSLTITNVGEIMGQLNRLTEATRGAQLMRAATAGALIPMNAAKRRAPWRTGTLRRSIHIGGHTEMASDFSPGEVGPDGKPAYSDIGSPAPEPTRVELLIGTNLVYAGIQEFGGVVSPKTAKLLAIPVDAAARTAGSPRGQDLVFVKTQGGQMFLMDKEGKIRYSLRRSVTIPAHPYLRPAFDENTEAIEREIGIVLREGIEDALAGRAGSGIAAGGGE